MPGPGDAATWGRFAGHPMDPRAPVRITVSYTKDDALNDARLEVRRNPYVLVWGLQDVLLAQGEPADAVDVEAVLARDEPLDTLTLRELFALLTYAPDNVLAQVRHAFVAKTLELPHVAASIVDRADELFNEGSD